MPSNKLKVLFFAEGATLAHVVRPLMLAQGLDPELFEPTLCRPRAFSHLTTRLPFSVIDLDCLDASTFAARLDRGLPLYDFQTLCSYVDTDLALINQAKPDVIIGDFRLSLSVSARLNSIPYITICDAYWSPERILTPSLPVLKFTRFAPISVSEFLFRQLAPLIFKAHAKPLECLRSKFGLPSLGYDLRRSYTDADLRLFANFPALFPDVRSNIHADFIGPMAWSPEFNGSLEFLEGDGPLTYVTMGSSGNPRIIEDIIPILEKMGSRIVVATAGKQLHFESKTSNTQIFDYLPGSIVCQHTDLVICNGGSPTTNQALSCGVPVLGICQNMDQFLNMEAISAYGAGLQLRADRATPSRLNDRISRLMHNHAYSIRAQQLARTLPEKSPQAVLTHFIQLLCSQPGETLRKFPPLRST